MMNLHKFIRITALVVVLALSTGVCFAQSVKTVNSPEELKNYLDSQPSNNSDKPIRVKITINNLMIRSTVDAIKSAGKYVNLDLSDSPLKDMTMSSFKGCSMLVGITMPTNLTSIGNNAFNSCTNLASVTVSNTVKTIGSNAFSNCTGLTTINISATDVGSNAFSGCTGLTTVNINSTDIGSNAFSGCVRLNKLNIGNDGKNISIGSNAFSGCTGLTTVNIPNSVKTIGMYAFSDCTGLTSVTIGNGVTKVWNWAFAGCTKLVTITVAEDNTKYCSQDGILYTKNKNELVAYPAAKKGSFTIPNDVTVIWAGAFADCIGLTSVTIGNSVTNIMEGAFSGCSNLASVDIGSRVASIEKNAFHNCTNLTSVTFTSMISSSKFHNEAFSGPGLPGLREKYLTQSGGRGTYKREKGGTTWAKQ